LSANNYIGLGVEGSYLIKASFERNPVGTKEEYMVLSINNEISKMNLSLNLCAGTNFNIANAKFYFETQFNYGILNVEEKFYFRHILDESSYRRISKSRAGDFRTAELRFDFGYYFTF